MKKTILGFTILAITTLILFSCCPVNFSKSSSSVSINSNSSVATVSFTDKKSKDVYKRQTPATVTFKSGAGYFSKAPNIK